MSTIRTYTADELEDMDTIRSAHSQDLKVEEHGFSVWLDRTGEDEEVQYEINVGGRWYPVRPDTIGQDRWVIYT